MGNTRPCARPELPAAVRTLGFLSALTLGGLWLARRSDRRRRTEPRPVRGCRDLVEESMNLLGAVRGYCELAKLKGENGGVLESRMDASIETVDQVSVLLRQLLADCRKRAR